MTIKADKKKRKVENLIDTAREEEMDRRFAVQEDDVVAVLQEARRSLGAGE